MATIAPAMGHDSPQAIDEKVQWQPQSLEQYQGMNVLDVATCSNASQNKVKAKRKNDSLSATLCAAIVKHQLGMQPRPHILVCCSH